MSHESPAESQGPVTPHPPREGFSKGTMQGLMVTFALLLLLIGLQFLVGTGNARNWLVISDLIFAVIVAVVGVWVVGGIIEINTKLYDVGVKAAGGIALILLFTIYFKPFSSSDNYAPHSLVFEVNYDGDIGAIIDEALKFPEIRLSDSGDEEIFRAFNPNRSKEPIDYFGNDPTIFTPFREASIIQVLQQVDRASDCVNLERKGNDWILFLDRSRIEETSSENGSRKIYRCAS